MRLALICCEYPPGPHGGIGTSTQTLGRALACAGHEVRVVGFYPSNYPAPDYEEDQGVAVWRFPRRGYPLGWVVDRYRLFRILSRWAQRQEIDLIELPDYQGLAAGWPRLPVPVVSRWRGTASYFFAEMGRPPRAVDFWLERASLRRSDYHCAISKYAAQRTQEVFGLPHEPDAVIYNSVAVPHDLRAGPRSGWDVVFTGTLGQRKGVVSLIQAWPQVQASCPQARLHFFGKDGRAADGGSMQAHLLGLLEEPLRPSVAFHGHVGRRTLWERLGTARVGVFPSYSETFGNAPVEAMACGCPTIASTRSTGPELVRDGIDGLLADPDRPEQIAEAILRVLRDEDLAKRLGEAGRERAQERFSLPAVVVQNEDFYRRSLDDFARRSSRERCELAEKFIP